MTDKGKSVKKQLDHTWVEVNKEVHTFMIDDQTSDDWNPYRIAKNVKAHERCQYVHYIKYVSHDVEKEVAHLCHYSKKLATALGSSTQLLVLHSENWKSAGLWKLSHFPEVHFKNS